MEYTEYLTFLEELGQVFDQMVQIEGDKTAAVRRRDLAALEACMKQEQAMSLTLRGQEQKRQKILAALGLRDVPLREMPDRCPPEYRGQTIQAVDALMRKYGVLKSAQEPARVLLESRLRLTEQELDRRGLDPKEEQVSAAVPRWGRNHTDFKV